MNVNIRKFLSILLALAMLVIAMPTQAKATETSSMPEGLFQAALESTSQPISARGANSGGLDFTFHASGLQAGNANWGIALNGFGRGDQVNALGAADAKEVEGRVQYERPELTEWYRDTAFGLEQGFTVPQSPSGKGALVLRMALSTDMVGTLDKNARGLSFANADGKTLRYDHLKVWDADGKELDAQMAYAPGQVEIRVNDAGAAYPVTIDPLIYAEQQVAGTHTTAGQFGRSVALSGNTALIGAPFDNSQGSAYIFTKSGDIWSLAAKLTASEGATSDEFGMSVAISGDTAIVGAYQADVGANANQGSAYIFVKPSSGWTNTSTFTAKLTASDGAADDGFGYTVATSGDTVLVGAYGDDIGTNANQGSAYIFAKPGGGWATTSTFNAKLTASDGAADDVFGQSVALSGTTALIGAFQDNVGANADQGSAYVFAKPGGGWATGIETAKLTASDGVAWDHFGCSVSVSGDTVLIGAYGNDIGANWDQGSAYVFVRPGGGWATTSTYGAILTASDGVAGDYFGETVAISSNAALIGMLADDINKGSAYVFVKPIYGWGDATETVKFTASDGATNDYFGSSVALSGNTALIGARQNNSLKGSAYFFGPLTDLSVSATVNPGSAKPGETVYLIASVTNYGGTTSGFGQIVNAALPAGLTYVSSLATHGSYNSATGQWTVGAFAPYVTATLTIIATVNPQAPQTRTFTASLVGTDTNSANNSASATLTVLPFTATFRSQGTNDGWVLESTETSNVGGSKNFSATTFRVGDGAGDKQYRGLLSFDTSSLPDTAVVTKVTLKIRQSGAPVGTNPFTILGALRVDIRKPYFGGSVGLANGDFQAVAGMSAIGSIPNTPVGSWYTKVWSTDTFFSHINRTGTTQFRLRFNKDDNNDNAADYLKFISGNHATASVRPTLIIEYYVP